MSYLTEDALEFARVHITNFYDSDFYPKPFEYAAIWHNWEEVRQYLLSKPINDITIETPKTFCCPKTTGSFRIVHQLDPITSLVYTAITYSIAEAVERLRPTREERIACSYRVKVDKKRGALFSIDLAYQDYIGRCKELASENEYVLATDVVSFYNQIYIHRVENAVALVDDEYAKSLSKPLERLLLDIASNTSQGIPVGPAASIIIAEAIMIDVDEFIKSSGFQHTRYVDDIRIFSNNEKELIKLLDKLTLYLHDSHRLALSTQKTNILDKESFTAKYLTSPEITEKNLVHDKLRSIRVPEDAYGSYTETPVSETEVRPGILSGMLEEQIKNGVLDLGLARHVLKRARECRIRSILNILLENFDFFGPVMPHFVLYLKKISNEKIAKQRVNDFERIITNSKIAELDFIKIWLSEYLCDYPDYTSSKIISLYIASSKNYAARTRSITGPKAISEFRRKKATVCHMSEWERRAFLLQTKSITHEERRAYLDSLTKQCQDNIATLSVIKWLRATS